MLHRELILIVEQEQTVDGDNKQAKLNNMSPHVKKLTSGIVVGYPNGRWQEVRDNRPKKSNEAKDNEEKGKEVAGKGVNNVEQAIVPVQTTNKFTLLEEGEIQEDVRVKKEELEKVLNEENMEGRKCMISNPTPTGKATPKKNGTKSTGKENIPNPTVHGIEETNMKESIIEWVNRRFSTNKDELRELNVTANNSCQEVPSQNLNDSTKNNVTNNATLYDNSL